MPIVEIPMAHITDWDTFHDTFAKELGFPDYYGRNMNAWIDCLTYEDDGMTAHPVQAGDVLTLQLVDCREFRARCPSSTKLSSTPPPSSTGAASSSASRRSSRSPTAEPAEAEDLSQVRWAGSMAPLRHDQPGWDMHDHGAELARAENDRLSEGTHVCGIVVCHHHYGLGVYIPDRDEYGHVNLPVVGPGRLRGPQDFPAIGTKVNATVFGYTGIDAQLRLWIYRPEPAADSD